MSNLYEHSMSRELGRELMELNQTLGEQELLIDELKLSAAMYKASFFGKYNLADKLREQIRTNYNSLIGDWDGFCHASWRHEDEYKTLREMYKKGLISKEEYTFCKLL